jgi:hypothetical protein
MTVAFRRLSALTACLALAACQPATETRTAEAPAAAPAAPPPAAAAPVTFAHDPALDAFGYYFTQADVQSGNLKLTSLNIGQAADFADWEAGKRPATYAPIFLAFEDVTSPTAENELGQINHTVSIRVMPTSYRVDTGQVSFHGTDPNLGSVTFTGVFDLAVLKTSKAAGPNGAPVPVLKGELRVGDQDFRDISFLYFGGE